MGMKLPADKRLDEIFGISEEIADTLPSTIVEEERTQSVYDRTESVYDPDTEDAIELLKRTVITGEELLDNMKNVAISSEKARDYEVAAKLMSSVAEVARTIIEEKRKKAMLEAPAESKVTNNNTLVLQSTEDLLRLIHNSKKDA